MPDRIVFIIKIVLFSFATAFALGALTGIIVELFRPSHAHQVIPNWILYGLLNCIVNIVTSFIIILIFVFSNKYEVLLSLAIINGLNIFLILFWTIFF